MASTISTPRYIMSIDKQSYIPAKLRKCLNPNNKLVPDGYKLCLVGEQESMAADLKDKGYTGKSFIHLDAAAIAKGGAYAHLSAKMKNAITAINDMVKQPNTVFNTDPKLGIHTLGFVPIDEIADLNVLGYGLLSWYGIYVYDNEDSDGDSASDDDDDDEESSEESHDGDSSEEEVDPYVS